MNQAEVQVHTVDELKQSLGALKLMSEESQEIQRCRLDIANVIQDYELAHPGLISDPNLYDLRRTFERYNATLRCLVKVRTTIMNLLPKLVLSESRDELLLSHIDTLGLSTRANNVLGGRLNIELLGELVQYRPDELLEAKNFGKTSLDETQTALEQKGWKLGEGATWKNTAQPVTATH